MTNNNRHTPGPWKLGGLYNQNIFVPDHPQKGSVKHIATLEADIDGMKYGYTVQQQANSRLIAAAPDYYEAVEYWLDQIYDGEPLKDWQVQLVEAHRKAKGE